MSELKMLSIRMPEDMRKALKMMAYQEGISVQALIIRMAEELMSKYEGTELVKKEEPACQEVEQLKAEYTERVFNRANEDLDNTATTFLIQLDKKLNEAADEIEEGQDAREALGRLHDFFSKRYLYRYAPQEVLDGSETENGYWTRENERKMHEHTRANGHIPQ